MLFQRMQTLETRFEAEATGTRDFQPHYNISPGTLAPVITNQAPDQIQLFQFGLTPYWAKKPMYLFNARSEGNFNKENKRDYQGEKGIVDKPSFKKPIRSQRCLVPVNCFVEGTTKEKLDKPHLVYLDHPENLFALAGIWDEWLNQATGELRYSFSIITTVANEALAKIPHHRSPVILDPAQEKAWLSTLPLPDVLDLLAPYPAERMQIHPISKEIKNPRNNQESFLEATGPEL